MTTFKETHWFLFNKVVQTCLAKYLQRTLYAQNSLRIVCLIFCMLWRGIDTDQREWFISHFFIHRAKVVTLLARSIHHCKIFMCSFERRREKKIQRNFITVEKNRNELDLPLFTVLVSPSFPSAFVLLFSLRSRLISKLILLSPLCPRFCSSSELLLLSSELCPDRFVSEFSFSCSFSSAHMKLKKWKTIEFFVWSKKLLGTDIWECNNYLWFFEMILTIRRKSFWCAWCTVTTQKSRTS